MNKDLVNALTLLRDCRDALVLDFTKKDSDRYYYSFRFGKSLASFEIAKCLTEHQWLDSHFNYASTKFEQKEISKSCLIMFLDVLKKMSIIRLGNHDNRIQQELNTTKIIALETMLSHSESMDAKLRLIEFDYFRDKTLFERAMEKYTSTVENKSDT